MKSCYKYLSEPYKDIGEYRKYVFGEITYVWKGEVYNQRLTFLRWLS